MLKEVSSSSTNFFFNFLFSISFYFLLILDVQNYKKVTSIDVFQRQNF